MKRPLFYTVIVVLYLAAPICIMAALGTMVSKKYEIDESYWKIHDNSNLTEEQKKHQSDALDKRGKQVERRAAAFVFVAFAAPITATTLLVKRCKILGRQKAAVNSALSKVGQTNKC